MKKVLVAFAAVLGLSAADVMSDSLAAHNTERNAHGVPSLTWSSSLAQSAQAYAEVMASTGTTSHSTGRNNVGENLAWGSGSNIDTTSLAGLWIDEKEYYIPGVDFPDCSNTGSWHDVAHYTQLMWEKTTELGCGLAKSSSGRNYYVCHYSPQGNMDGESVYTEAAPIDSTDPVTTDPVTTDPVATDPVTSDPTTQDNSNDNNNNNHDNNDNHDDHDGHNNNYGKNNDNRHGNTRGGRNHGRNHDNNNHNDGGNSDNNNNNNDHQNHNDGGNSDNTHDQTDPSTSDPTTTPTTPSTTPSTSPSTSQSSGSQDQFITDSLAAHNNERAAHGVPALVWSTELAQSAQAYAETQARTGTTSHSTGRNNVGENLAWGSGSRINTASLAGMWVAEKKYFIAGKNFPDCSTTGSWHDVAHYTQLMWRKTTQLGCGIAKASSGTNYYVCHYSPQGNINGNPVY